ncbi:MAG: hypothetical protein ACOC0P_07050 [Planctomycetota bacterium]
MSDHGTRDASTAEKDVHRIVEKINPNEGAANMQDIMNVILFCVGAFAAGVILSPWILMMVKSLTNRRY